MTRQRLLFWMILIMAAVLRGLFIFGNDLWQMEALHGWLSRLGWVSLVETLGQNGIRPPLYHCLLKIWGSLSQHEVWLRLLSVSLSTAAVGLVYLAVKRLFCWRTGIVSAALCAASPLLVTSVGSTVAPQALDLFLCSLSLYTFVRLVSSPGWKVMVIHGLVLAAAMYANYFMVSLLFMEALFLAIYFKNYRPVWFTWVWSSCIAFLLFCPWFATAGKQMHRIHGHDDLITDSTPLRVSCLLTELAMGRLYAWYPLTPVLSLLPAPASEEETAFGSLYPEGLESGAVAIQAVQTGFMGAFFLLAALGVGAAMGISGFSFVPRHTQLLNKIKARGSACPVCNSPAFTDRKHSAILLALYLSGPLVMGIVLSGMKGGAFEGSELVFVALPYLVLVARGVGTLEWKPMFYGFLGLILLTSMVFSVMTRSLGRLTEGAQEAAAYLQERNLSGEVDAVVHGASLSYFPLLFYSRGEMEEITFFDGQEFRSALGSPYVRPKAWLDKNPDLTGYGQVWQVAIDAPEDSVYAKALDYFDLLSREGGEEEFIPFHESAEGWAIQDTIRFENIVLTRYRHGDEGK